MRCYSSSKGKSENGVGGDGTPWSQTPGVAAAHRECPKCYPSFTVPWSALCYVNFTP